MSEDEIKDIDAFGDESLGGPSDDILKKGKVGDDDIFGDDLSDDLIAPALDGDPDIEDIDALADAEDEEEMAMDEEEDAW